MLILTRRATESITIGDTIKVTILEARNGQVRVGIDAPRDIPVHREEIFRKIKKEQANGR